MTDQEWLDWAEYHAAMFGMDREQDVATFHAWRNVFASQGFSFVELRLATEWLATQPAPGWRDKHLAALQERVREQRRDAAARREAEAVSYADCRICRGSGWVSVPDLRQVRELEWLGYATCAVLCLCSWGEREAERHPRLERPLLTLAVYERHNPRWEGQLEHRRQLEAEQVRARQTSAAADKLFGPLVRRLREREADEEGSS